MKNLKLISMSFACVLWFWSCTRNIAGVTDTGNPPDTKTTVSSNNNSIRVLADKGVRVTVYSIEYVPYSQTGYSASILVNDTNGAPFGPLDSGYYNVIALDSVRSISAFLPNVPVGISETTFVATDSLDTTTTITGVVRKFNMFQGIDSLLPEAWVYALGTPFVDKTDKTGSFSLQTIPVGTIEVRAYWIPSPEQIEEGHTPQNSSPITVTFTGDSVVTMYPTSATGIFVEVDKK